MFNNVSRMTYSMTGKSVVVAAQIGEKINLQHDGWNLVNEFDVSNEEHYNAVVTLGERLWKQSVTAAEHLEVIVDFISGYAAINITKKEGRFDIIFNANTVTEYETPVFTGRNVAKLTSINMSKGELMNIVRALHACFLTPID